MQRGAIYCRELGRNTDYKKSPFRCSGNACEAKCDDAIIVANGTCAGSSETRPGATAVPLKKPLRFGVPGERIALPQPSMLVVSGGTVTVCKPPYLHARKHCSLLLGSRCSLRAVWWIDAGEYAAGAATCSCTTIYDPVCQTSTNTTLANACQAGCSGITDVVAGACPGERGT